VTPLKTAVIAVLALPLGAGLAFLSLEVIGVPLLVVAMLIGYRVGRRASIDSPLWTACFGVAFAGTVAFFALRTSGIFSGAANTGTVPWFVFWFLFGCTLACGGFALLIRRLVSGTVARQRSHTE
jgi:hypothetical protein